MASVLRHSVRGRRNAYFTCPGNTLPGADDEGTWSATTDGAGSTTLELRRAQSATDDERPFGIELSMAVLHRATRIARSLFEGGDSLVILVQDGVAPSSTLIGAAM